MRVLRGNTKGARESLLNVIRCMPVATPYHSQAPTLPQRLGGVRPSFLVITFQREGSQVLEKETPRMQKINQRENTFITASFITKML